MLFIRKYYLTGQVFLSSAKIFSLSVVFRLVVWFAPFPSTLKMESASSEKFVSTNNTIGSHNTEDQFLHIYFFKYVHHDKYEYSIKQTERDWCLCLQHTHHGGISKIRSCFAMCIVEFLKHSFSCVGASDRVFFILYHITKCGRTGDLRSFIRQGSRQELTSVMGQIKNVPVWTA